MAKVICFDGVNGVGKSYLINNFKDKLEESGKRVLLLREPGGTKFGEQIIRPIVKNLNMEYKLDDYSRFFLFMASRSANVEMINKNSEYFDYIIFDRFTPSTLVYNYEELNIDFEVLYSMEKLARHSFKPDLTFYIYASTDLIVNRWYERDYEKTIGNDGVRSLDMRRRLADKADKLRTLYINALAYLSRVEKWNIINIYHGVEEKNTLDKLMEGIGKL